MRRRHLIFLGLMAALGVGGQDSEVLVSCISPLRWMEGEERKLAGKTAGTPPTETCGSLGLRKRREQELRRWQAGGQAVDR